VKHFLLMMFLGIAMLVTSVAAQEVREILRFTNKAVDNTYEGAGSIIRASRYGLAVVTGRGIRVNGQFVEDTVSTIYYLRDADSDMRRLDVPVRSKWPSQAVVGDSVMYIVFDTKYPSDSIFVSVNIHTGVETGFPFYYPPAPLGRYTFLGWGGALSFYGGRLAGFSIKSGVCVLDVERRRALLMAFHARYPDSPLKYEVVVFQDASILLMTRGASFSNGPSLSNRGVFQAPPEWATSSTFTEIGDSVYWPTNVLKLSRCALSTVTGTGACARFHADISSTSWYSGLAGRHGVLTIPVFSEFESTGPIRARYYRLSLPDSIEYLLPVRDSSIEIIGGAWWREKFYVAVRLGEANQTVVYEIAEPAPVVSVSETKLPDGTATSHRMAFTQSRFATWIRELQDTSVEIYDVLGVRQQTSSMRPGMYAVRVGEQISVVVVTEEE